MKTNWKTIAMGAALFATLVPGMVQADQLFIRNRSFKGTTITADGALWVELKPLAEALGANLIDNGKGGFAMSLDPIPKIAAQDVPADKLVVGADTVDVQIKNGVALVPLEVTAKLLKARVSANKQLHTIDVNFVTAPQASAPEPAAQTPPPETSSAAKPKKVKLAKNQGAAPSRVAAQNPGQSVLARQQGNPYAGKIVHIHGKITLEGADRVGLFADGSASVPYKVGTVDAQGNYKMDIDMDKDMHSLAPGMVETDMRFYSSQGFEMCHGKCNFIVATRNDIQLDVYGGPAYHIKNFDLEYTEKD